MIRLFASMALCVSGSVYGQAGVAPQFEVASVKLTPADLLNRPSGGTTGKGRFTYTNVTLKRCIMGAFGLGPNQILGGPQWLDADHYEIVAKAEQPTDDEAVLDQMMQALLIDRFKLAFHRETRTMQAYVLELAKNGPKLEVAQNGEPTTRSGRGIIDAKITTMTHFAEVLSRVMDLPVVNQTGLEGIFNLKMEWTPEITQPVKLPDGVLPDSGPSVFTAIQQFGLRLSTRKAPVEVLVIDRVERPTEN